MIVLVIQECESQVFYHKMKGDYYRYISEFSSDQGRQEASAFSKESYQKATEIAESQLKPTHPIRLGLALNYSGTLMFSFSVFLRDFEQTTSSL